MFVISKLQDLVEIKASEVDKNQAIMDALIIKYTFKLIDGLGLSVHISKLCEILELEIKSEILVANIIFEVVFYRFYQDEIATGKIIRQEEEKILVEDGLTVKYEINAADLFENSEFESINDSGRWIWNYKGNHLPFQMGESVRFRIKRLNADNVIEASMNEQGLGPTNWWD